MLKNSILFVVLSCTLILSSCNPSCDPISGLQVIQFSPAGYEIAITATPLSQLEGKDIFFGNTQVPAGDIKMENGFLRVKIPSSLKLGNTTLKIENPDCQDILQVDFTIASPDTFRNNINFVMPVMPEIYIPNFNFTSFPSSINNAWVNPINPDYCLWLTAKKTKVIFQDTSRTVYSLSNGSFELTPCCLAGDPKCQDPTKLHGTNPISGFYDTIAKPRMLHFFIDRTSKKGGTIEEYEGVFLDSKTTKYDNVVLNSSATTPSANITCGGELKQPADKPMLLITSKKTGKQTVLYRTIRFD